MKSHQKKVGPFDVDHDFVKGVRSVFMSAHFTEEGILGRLDCGGNISVAFREIPRLLSLTEERTALDILIRLFLLGVKVDITDVDRALKPMTLDSWRQAGLLSVNGTDEVMAPLRLIPYEKFLFAFDPPISSTDEKINSNYVPGMGPISIKLLNATIRNNVNSALDLGTGCGVQGLMCSRHSKQVICTDVNDRALNITDFNILLNGLENIETRRGSLFEPVQGSAFDLITMNPPFAISPDKDFLYRDGNTEEDEFVQKIVHQAPQYLTEGGYCQFTAQWAHIRGQKWHERFAQWFTECGCDAWIINLATQSVETYAANWLTETEKHDLAGYTQRWQEWMSYYEKKGIEKVSTGIITLRSMNRQENRFWITEDVEQIGPYAGDAIISGFILHDFLAETEDDILLTLPLRIVPEARLDEISRCHGEGWHPEKIVIRLTKGLHYTGIIDTYIAWILSQCNGIRTLGQIINNLASSLNLESNKFTATVLPIMRTLIERGFVLPSGL